MSRPHRIIIIGNGMAGHRLVEQLLAHDTRDIIQVFSAEPGPSYNRILISAWLAGDCLQTDLYDSATPKSGVRYLDHSIVAIDRDAHAVQDDTGARHHYDQLVLATGSTPILLSLPGDQLAGVQPLRTLADARTLIDRALPGQPAVVIGGGLLGLEAAWGLHQRGMEVTILHRMPVLMERQLDTLASGIIIRHLQKAGIRVVMEADLIAYEGDDRLTQVRLRDGSVFNASLAVVSIGTRPNVALARTTGLVVNRGVLVGDDLRTSDPDILAIGECAEHRGICYGLVDPCFAQAEICAQQLRYDSDKPAYTGSQLATRLKVSGIELFAAGECTWAPGDSRPDVEFITVEDDGGVYRKLIVHRGSLIGALLLGDAHGAAWYTDLMRSGARFGGDVASNAGLERRALVFGPEFSAALAARRAA
jgi:nitrite reductase (NADH) large subunit